MRLIKRSHEVLRILPIDGRVSVKMLTKKCHPSLKLAGTLKIWKGL